jgi:hypothetical protein
MTTGSPEQRYSLRATAAYPATIRDRSGRIVARGRTASISEQGASILAPRRKIPPPKQEVFVELTIPTTTATPPRRQAKRTVHYRSRIIHAEALSQHVSWAVEFLEKLS